MFEGLFQPMHLLIILVVGLFLFGPKKLPELGKGLGEGIRGFKKALNDVTDATKEDPTNNQIQ
ncbi:MAG TPA: twin-arginine translocase TatA/TatE family subunit [Bryobacteraceae bacterium]|nr:twin-arginine translocase TatA/TatE family subunit [Bryobacteraceae bacterium]